LLLPDLFQSLSFLVREVQKISGLPVRLQAPVGGIILVAEQHYQVYHIVVEALNNVAKHAQATAAEIKVEVGNDRLTITVRDNGIGFKSGSLPDDHQHQGLANMLQRARLIGGDLSYQSAPGAGTEVILTVPQRLLQKG